MTETEALEEARSYGFEGDRLPWFGVFVEYENGVHVITAHTSPADAWPSVQIAQDFLISEGVQGYITLSGHAGPVAGYVIH